MSELSISLVGNPNSGKTTLFNKLTGARQRVGNWPGVTVERKTGQYTVAGRQIDVLDLPGVYSLMTSEGDISLDEKIACEAVLSGSSDIIVNVVDASNLERNLYLTTQLIELQVPMIVVLNMVDVAKKRGMKVDTDQLSARLGCPVVSLQATKGKGLDALKSAIDSLTATMSRPKQVTYPVELEPYVEEVGALVSDVYPKPAVLSRWLSVRLLENDLTATSRVSAAILEGVKSVQVKMTADLDEDGDILFADARYQFIAKQLDGVLIKNGAKSSVTQGLDKIVLNRFLGIPVFLFVMYLMFFFSINVGGAFQDFFDLGSDALFVQGLSQVLTSWHLPDWFVAIFGVGVGRGINTTLTFIPVIASMFIFLSLLEHSGYMTRAAFVVDRFMRALGLPGKSFVPMIVGFGCNVPAIMGTRTLDNQQDRILTVLMAPFMSCGARLAIYAVFTAAFFPRSGALVVFSLYMIGILLAVFTGLLLRKTLLRGESSPLVMELPPYHMPTLSSMCLQTWQRLKGFVLKAGRYIVPVCVLLSALNAVNINGGFVREGASENSVLAHVGRAVTPVFSPMGVAQENWPATVGLMTGMLAKEVVIGTLNTLYADRAHLNVDDESQTVGEGLMAAVQSIPENFSELGHSLANPIAASATSVAVTTGVYGQLYRYFDGQAGAYAYLLFILLYIPCISTIAAIARELTRGWAVFSVAWNTGVAYSLSVVFYQVATFVRHPVGAVMWSIGFLGVFFAVVLMLRANRNLVTTSTTGAAV